MIDDLIASWGYATGSALLTTLTIASGWMLMWHAVLKTNPIVREVLLGETPSSTSR